MILDYYKTKASVEEYIRLAEGVNGGELIKKLKSFLPENSYLLEIGSGPGSDYNLLISDYQVLGSDNSPEFIEHLKTRYPAGHFLELDAVTLQIEEKFDGIYSNKVMHHLQNAELIDSITRQHDILSRGGIICHSFWAGEGSEIFKGLFVNYHTEDALTEFFGDLFDLLLIEKYAEFEEADSLVLIGRKRN